MNVVDLKELAAQSPLMSDDSDKEAQDKLIEKTLDYLYNSDSELQMIMTNDFNKKDFLWMAQLYTIHKYILEPAAKPYILTNPKRITKQLSEWRKIILGMRLSKDRQSRKELFSVLENATRPQMGGEQGGGSWFNRVFRR